MAKKIKIDISMFELPNDHIMITPIEVEHDEFLQDPEQYDDKPEYGKVVGVGAKVTSNIKLKDIILFGKWSTVMTRINGADYHILREEDIISKINVNKKKNP